MDRNMDQQKGSFQNKPNVDQKIDQAANLGAGITENLSQKAAPAINYLRDQLPNLKNRTQDYLDSAGTFVRQYPVYSVVGAVAIGFIVGSAIARPSVKSI